MGNLFGPSQHGASGFNRIKVCETDATRTEDVTDILKLVRGADVSKTACTSPVADDFDFFRVK